MISIPTQWKRAALATAAQVGDAFAVGGIVLTEGMPMRLRGVLGTVGRAGREWVFLVDRHPMNGDPLAEHLGEPAAVPEP